jgi:hypothetical protein
LIVHVLAALALSACGPAEPPPTPTLSVEQIQTQAVIVFSTGLTQTALANPSPTSSATPSLTPFPTATQGTPLAVTTAQGAAPTSTCHRLVYIRDVTIPDNTTMTPGQTFTKTWEVQNSGSCAWDAGFKFNLIGGDAMGGQTLTLSQAVSAGSSTQLSVAMTAPTNKTGTVQGAWRMSTAAGAYFGDQLTVVIVIGGAGGSPTATPPTATPSPTATSE